MNHQRGLDILCPICRNGQILAIIKIPQHQDIEVCPPAVCNNPSCGLELKKEWLRTIVRSINPTLFGEEICNESLWLDSVDNPIEPPYNMGDVDLQDRLHAKAGNPFNWAQWTIAKPLDEPTRALYISIEKWTDDYATKLEQEIMPSLGMLEQVIDRCDICSGKCYNLEDHPTQILTAYTRKYLGWRPKSS